SDAEINAIEHGVANANDLTDSNIHNRLRATLWELNRYRTGGNPSGHSLTMRFEFWMTALQIIKQQPLTGVGTGDVPDAFAKKYDETNSMLDIKFRLRSHNQFLAVAVALGIPALILFIIMLFYPVFQSQYSRSFLFMTFWITAFLSMLTEDTLETQAGVSFFIFFSCLFLFLKNKELDKNII
ncbi:MAG TPA: O-antigen ligase family protein, partial [Bacteroidia bacterium]|nr:O-antigen ligase family protein [Bacteroidia bacterium]